MTTKLQRNNQPETINPVYCRDLHPAKALGFRIPSNIPNAPSHCTDAPYYPGRSQVQCETLRSIDSHRPHLGTAGEGGIGPSAPAFTNAHRGHALPCHQRHDLPRKMAIHRGYALALVTCHWRKKPTQTSHHGTQCSHVGMLWKNNRHQSQQYQIQKQDPRCAGRPRLGNGSIGFATVSIHQPVPNINPIQRCRAPYPGRSQGRYET